MSEDAQKSKQILIACDTKDHIPVSELVPYQKDLKSLSKKDYARLRDEIVETGFAFPIYVWKHPDGKPRILGGHQRARAVLAMIEEGYVVPPLPVVFISARSEPEAKRRILQDISQYGTVDDQGLYEFIIDAEIDVGDMAESFNIPGVDVDKFSNEFFKEPPIEGQDDAPPVPKNPVTRLGDLWQLGRHRLMCGDSTSHGQVTQLMAGNRADLVFTDPPYGVNYDGGHAEPGKRRERLANDNSTDIYTHSLPLMAEFSKKTAALYLWFAATKSLQVLQAIQDNGYEVRSWLIWNKNMAQFGAIGAQYKQKHEPCLYAFKSGSAPFWSGPNNEVSVWDIARASKNEFHPTQKPVDLARRAIANSCPDQGSVLDLFGGSGSTLIACETSGRSCFAMELDPGYCDVIVQRWEDLTGQKATRHPIHK